MWDYLFLTLFMVHDSFSNNVLHNFSQESRFAQSINTYFTYLLIVSDFPPYHHRTRLWTSLTIILLTKLFCGRYWLTSEAMLIACVSATRAPEVLRLYFIMREIDTIDVIIQSTNLCWSLVNPWYRQVVTHKLNIKRHWVYYSRDHNLINFLFILFRKRVRYTDAIRPDKSD